jgi:hypothetical protein
MPIIPILSGFKGCLSPLQLQESNIAFNKIHDLSRLLDLLLPVEPNWEILRPKFEVLTAYAVEFRYPGISANKDLATQSFQDCVTIRQTIRQKFSL